MALCRDPSALRPRRGDSAARGLRRLDSLVGDLIATVAGAWVYKEETA
jgi:hypothetical protein